MSNGVTSRRIIPQKGIVTGVDSTLKYAIELGMDNEVIAKPMTEMFFKNQLCFLERSIGIKSK